MEQEKINRLQWILDDAVARGEIPGAILMVRREGKETVYLESGYADIEAKKPGVERQYLPSLFYVQTDHSNCSDDSGGAGTDRSGRSGMYDIFLDFVDKWWQHQTDMWKSHGEIVTIQDLVNMTSGLVYDGNHLTGKQTEALLRGDSGT